MGRAAVSGGDSAFRCLHKRDVLVGNRMSCERLQSGDALGVWLAVAHQNPVDRARHLDVRRTRAAAAHADTVVAADIISGGHRVKRTDILTCATQSADHCASANAGELMNACAAARDHAVADLGVSGEERVVGEHAVARDLNIVGRMRAGHPEITITDAGGAVVAGRAVNRHMFAKAVGIADHDSRAVLGVMEALVLRSEADGNAGQGGGGGSSKIICTKLYELGLMDKDIYLADQAFGAKLIQSHPDIYNGYRAWAEIVVDWMNGSGPKMMPWMSDQQFSAAAKKWSVSWAQDIATPWAESMAYQMGQRESDNFTGKMITLVGTPICKVVGVWQRVFGRSQQPAGFVKGAMLIPVFVLLKIVAVLGKLIQRR